MEPTEVKAHIQKGSFYTFYIFTGPEWKIQRIYLEQIAKSSGKELRYIDSISDIYHKKSTRAFVSKSYVYVVRDDKELMQNEKLQSQLKNIVGSNILILLLTSVDKRTKFYKKYKDDICEFEVLKPAVLAKYLQREVALSDKNCNKLMEACEYDYGRCLLEIDKLQRFISGNRVDNRDLSKSHVESYPDYCFRLLLEKGVVYQPPKDAIFDFVDAVLDGNVSLSFELYRQCIAVGEAVMVMLTVLYNNAKAVLQVKNCTGKDVVKSTGLSSWQVMNAKKHLHKRSNRELLDILEICHECQKSIVTGALDEEFVMEYILTSVL